MNQEHVLHITSSNPIIKNHIVNGAPLLPGLSYIDIIYQVAREVYNLDPFGYCIKKLKIFNPLIVREEQSVELSVFFEKVESHWLVKISGVINTPGEEKNSKLKIIFVTAELHEETIPLTECIDIEKIKNESEKCLDLEYMYSKARGLGLYHKEVIKAEGNVYISNNECLSEVYVSKPYHGSSKDYFFHPTLIDGAAMAFGFLESDNNQELYLPLYYDAFYGAEPMHTLCYAKIDMDSRKIKNDICKVDMYFYNKEGQQIAILIGITSKKVRSKDDIIQKHQRIIPGKTNDISSLQEKTFKQKKNDSVSPEYIKSCLIKILKNYFTQADVQINLDSEFYELGLESSQLLAAVKDMEKTLKVSLSPTALFEYSNLGELVQYILEEVEKVGIQALSRTNEKITDTDYHNKKAELLTSDSYTFLGNEAFLHDHLVFNEPALMGITHPCLAIESYFKNYNEFFPVEIRNIKFIGGPVTIGKEDSVIVKTKFAKNKGKVGFENKFNRNNSGHWNLCCVGDHIGPVDESFNTIDINKLISQSKQLDNNSISEFYNPVKEFNVGPMLQTIESAFRYDANTYISKVSLKNKTSKGGVLQYIFDPLLLNSCYFIFNNENKKEARNMFVPLMIENISVFKPMKVNAYIVNKIRKQKAQFVSVDSFIFSEKGDLIAEIRNASLKEVLDPSLLENAFYKKNTLKKSYMATSVTKQKETQQADIAIIGLAGHYPQSHYINDLWMNLQNGKDCITEIPKDRWDHSLYFDSERKEAGKTNGKWGGFISDVDKFDPSFFSISPREAELMDPQERLMLQTVWEAMEDAGYSKKSLKDIQLTYGKGVGVFTACMYQQYQLVANDKGMGMFSTNNYGFMMPNRISHALHFTGPSLAVDTACSSSLTAVHLACESIIRSECIMAIAGGVNLNIHPSKYISLTQQGLLSSKEKSMSLGDGDGYIPGEGVGVVLLKPLSLAIEHGDNIYAIIKSSHVNHGAGKYGVTSPDTRQQANLITGIFEKSGIEPRSISWVEVAATGLSLGDVSEIEALKKSFNKYTNEKSFCSIGTVKSNIGHLEAASGISQLTKVLLQIKNRTLVPSINNEPINPNITLNNSPFYIQKEVDEWKRPEINDNGKKIVFPRRALINSFGVGGSNACMIVQEHEQPEFDSSQVSHEPQLIVLSARNEQRLKAYIEKYIYFLEGPDKSNKKEVRSDGLTSNTAPSLFDMAYTLQTGREEMEERLAVAVSGIEELINKLKKYLDDNPEIEGLYKGNSIIDRKKYEFLEQEELWEDFITKTIHLQKLDTIARLWVSGVGIDWKLLYSDQIGVRRVSLPTYPFARETYWVGEKSNKDNVGGTRFYSFEEYKKIGNVIDDNINGLEFCNDMEEVIL